MAITPDQEQRLVSGGDCPDHFHTTDRLRTHNDLVALSSLEDSISITGNYTFGKKIVEYVLADTSLNNISLVLPDAKKMMKVTAVKMSALNTITVTAPNSVTINGVPSYAMNASYEVATFKAIGGNYYVVSS